MIETFDTGLHVFAAEVIDNFLTSWTAIPAGLAGLGSDARL